jgi:hypothetical protein
MKILLKEILIVALVLIALSSISFSQSGSTARIEGKVTDEEGNPLPGADVKLASPNMIGGTQSKITDSNGTFRFIGLQPGTYSIDASVPGFVPQRREEIRLFVGQTLTVDFVLNIGKVEQEVTVIAKPPLIDVKDSQVGTVSLDQEVLRNVIFSSSNYPYSTISLTPGVVGTAAYGAPSRIGNSYLMDGVEISYPESGADWGIVDYHAYSEARAQGLGAPAEYDGFGGVVLSMITKSGGNTFSGMIDIAYQDFDWRQKNIDISKPKFSLFVEPPKYSSLDVHFDIGGPIIKDKLWFYGQLKPFQDANTKYAGQEKIFTSKQPKYFVKLTWQLAKNTRISAGQSAHDFIYDQRGLGVLRPVEATHYEYAPDRIFNVNVLQVFSERTYAELRIGSPRMTSYIGGYAGGGGAGRNKGRDVSGHYDARTGMYSVNYESYEGLEAYRFTASPTLSHHADNFIKGSHDFKFGVEYESLAMRQEVSYNGGFFYRDNVYNFSDHKFHNYAYQYGYEVVPKGMRFSVFAQDAWKISNRITINPGIRYNIYRGSIKETGTTPFKTSAFAPRIGLSWDIFGDHTTVVKGHYGRYNDKLSTMMWETASTGYDDYVIYEVLPNGSKVEIFRYNYSNPATIDPDVKMPFMDQFTVGIEKELFKDTSIGVSFIYKKWGDFLARIISNYTSTIIPFTGKDEKGNALSLEVFNNTTKGTKFLVTNPTIDDSYMAYKPQRSFVGLMFQFEKRFSNNWMLAGSYVFSQTKEMQFVTGWTVNGLDPNYQKRSIWNGEVVAYPTHNFKLFGTFILPLDISINPTLMISSGNRWTRYVTGPDVAKSQVYIEKPGSNQLPHPVDLNVRIQKNFTLREGFRVGLLVDIYNALNQGRETSVTGLVTSKNFGKATAFNSGRAFKVGFRVYY